MSDIITKSEHVITQGYTVRHTSSKARVRLVVDYTDKSFKVVPIDRPNFVFNSMDPNIELWKTIAELIKEAVELAEKLLRYNKELC